MAVAPMTISYERQQVIDFTKPFMDLGLTVLISKEARVRDYFSFLGPFELSLWLAVGGSFVVCGFVVALLSWLSPYGYRGRYVQGRGTGSLSPEVRAERNLRNLWDSLWFSYSCWMQQVDAP